MAAFRPRKRASAAGTRCFNSVCDDAHDHLLYKAVTALSTMLHQAGEARWNIAKRDHRSPYKDAVERDCLCQTSLEAMSPSLLRLLTIKDYRNDMQIMFSMSSDFRLHSNLDIDNPTIIISMNTTNLCHRTLDPEQSFAMSKREQIKKCES
jgi:hypothetical protein